MSLRETSALSFISSPRKGIHYKCVSLPCHRKQGISLRHDLSSQIGLLLTDDILPDAFDYFTGKAESAAGVDYDSEDELDEEGGDDEEEIDLEEEEPARKRRKA